jgi:OmpR family two-component system bacitracin resistance response regulator BceR
MITMTKLDPNTITYDGKAVSRTEYLILKKLIDNKGKVVRKEELVSSVWTDKKYGKSDSITIHIGNIRKRIPTIPIFSKSGFGYIYV